jgi:hypothetical protein
MIMIEKSLLHDMNPQASWSTFANFLESLDCKNVIRDMLKSVNKTLASRIMDCELMWQIKIFESIKQSQISAR